MPRRAFLIAIVLLALTGCGPAAPSSAANGSGCSACHEPHRVGEGGCIDCHRGDAKALRAPLAHYGLIRGQAAEHRRAGAPAVVAGRHLVETLGCRRCHRVGREGNRHATSLDQVVWKREQDALAGAIRNPGENMPRFALSPIQTERVIAFLLHAADPAAAVPSYRVHFARSEPAAHSRFEERCGGCHRSLLAGGPGGRATAGPNLSGLLTEFYPRAAPEERRWTPDSLRNWLRNPRALRASAGMPPISLEEHEWRELLGELQAGTSTEGSPR